MLAYDSRPTAGDRIVDNNYNKRIDEHGCIFFLR